MFFWFIMLLVNLMFPAIMIFCGRSLNKPLPWADRWKDPYRPKVRTPMAMKNEDTWIFAHRTAGAYFLKWGNISLGLAIVPHLLVIGQKMDVIGAESAIVLLLLAILLLRGIVYTQRALRKNFDKEGKRREPQGSDLQ